MSRIAAMMQVRSGGRPLSGLQLLAVAACQLAHCLPCVVKEQRIYGQPGHALAVTGVEHAHTAWWASTVVVTAVNQVVADVSLPQVAISNVVSLLHLQQSSMHHCINRH
jgi:hypothetical protein